MRISLAAKRKPRVDGHEGAELRARSASQEDAAKNPDSRLAAQGRLRFGLGVRWSAQTAGADVAGGDGIAGRPLRVKESRKRRHVTQGRRIQGRGCSETDWLRRLGPVRDTCAKRSANIKRHAQETDSAAVMRDLNEPEADGGEPQILSAA